MLDLGFVRANLELVEEKLRARGADPAVLLGDFLSLDKRRRDAITQFERKKALQNQYSALIGQHMKAFLDVVNIEKLPEKDRFSARVTLNDVKERVREVRAELEELDKTAAELDEQLRFALARVPNLTRDEVPVGTSEADNVTVKTWGEPKKYRL